MGCNCGNKNAKTKFVYTDEKGQQREFNTDVEARAAKIRNAGQGSIREVAK